MYIFYNRKIIIILLFFLSLIKVASDDLGDLLQDLAVQTACLGMYSSTEAGVIDYITNRYIDPPDWYTPPMMAGRFASRSGNMTRTITFYGICFDYAQFAWDDIKKYQANYNKAGMKDQQWYIAVTFPDDPNTIFLYDPVTSERSTLLLNGIPVKEITRHYVHAHDNAAGHAWLWVQHKNGTWYWIDPTWTDNTGYPWWGIVEDGKEIQYYPNPAYSIANNYPREPRINETPAEKSNRSSNSTYVAYTAPPQSYGGITFSYISAFDLNRKFGFSLEIHDCLPDYENGIVGSLFLDYLNNSSSSNSSNALLVGLTAGYQFLYHFSIYSGGGIGFNFPANGNVFSWKLNGGLRLNLNWFILKLDVSYNQIIGPAFCFGLGVIPIELFYSISHRRAMRFAR